MRNYIYAVIAFTLSLNVNSVASQSKDPNWLLDLRAEQAQEQRCRDSGGTWDVGECRRSPSGGTESSDTSCGLGCKAILGVGAFLVGRYLYCNANPERCSNSQQERPHEHIQPENNQENVETLEEVEQTSKRIVEFIEEYHEFATETTRGLGRFYASHVDYADKGIISRARIEKEKAGVERVCPIRRYNVDYKNLAFRRNSENSDFYDVYYEVDTFCLGGKRETRRIWSNFIVIDLSTFSPKIVAARGLPRRIARH